MTRIVIILALVLAALTLPRSASAESGTTVQATGYGSYQWAPCPAPLGQYLCPTLLFSFNPLEAMHGRFLAFANLCDPAPTAMQINQLSCFEAYSSYRIGLAFYGQDWGADLPGLPRCVQGFGGPGCPATAQSAPR